MFKGPDEGEDDEFYIGHLAEIKNPALRKKKLDI